MADGQPARKTRDDRFRRQVLTKVDHFLSTMADVVQEYCEEHQVPLGTTSVSALLVMMRGGNRPRT